VDKPWTLKEDTWHGLKKSDMGRPDERPPQEPWTSGTTGGDKGDGATYKLVKTDIHYTDPRDPAPDPGESNVTRNPSGSGMGAPIRKQMTDIHVYGRTTGKKATPSDVFTTDAYTYTERSMPKVDTNHQRTKRMNNIFQGNNALGCRLNGDGIKDVSKPIRQKTDIHGNTEPLAFPSSSQETPKTSAKKCDHFRRKSDIHDSHQAPWGEQDRGEPRYSVPRRASIQEQPRSGGAFSVALSPGQQAANLFTGQSVNGPQPLDQRGHEIVTQWATRLRDQPY